MLCARFNRDDLVDWHVKSFIKNSRLASKEKIYKLTEAYCKYYVTPFIMEDPRMYYGSEWHSDKVLGTGIAGRIGKSYK